MDAWAQEPPHGSTSSTDPSSAPTAPSRPAAVPTDAPLSSTPPAATPPASTPPEAKSAPGTAFSVDPLSDAAVIALAAGFGGVLEIIISTGEVRPQQISPTFNSNQLFFLDRGAVTQHVDTNAGTYSNIGLGVALAYALFDPIETGIRDRNVSAGLVDAILYAETLAITTAVTDLAKIAVRRPRPFAYTLAAQHKDDPNYSNSDTDSSLSFFSGHTSTTAALAATATYLAFVRAPKGSARPWITLVAGTALTTFVGYERVRAGKHFPTDVIAGALAGAGIGLLVPHLHHADPTKQRTYWLGASPVTYGGVSGAMASLNGVF